MGSITHILDETGNIANWYIYDVWGQVTDKKEEMANRFQFTGQQFDPITQQYYLRARFYNPAIARFTQEDSYLGDGLNLYASCANNPVYYVDPTGNEKKDQCKSKDVNNTQKSFFQLPDTVKSAKGVEGEFSEKGYEYRVDTNKIAPGEGGFHIHIYYKGKEIAKIEGGRGTYVKTHKGNTLKKPSEMNKAVRRDINRLIRHVKKKMKQLS